MSKPKLMLLDEPSLGLAPILVEEIFEIIREINTEGTNILLVEQNANLAISISQYAYILETGKIALSGVAQDLMNKEEVKKLVTNALTAGRHALFEPEAKNLVSAWGIQVPRSVLIKGLENVALKSKARIAGFLLEETVPTGIELIIGGFAEQRRGL